MASGCMMYAEHAKELSIFVLAAPPFCRQEPEQKSHLGKSFLTVILEGQRVHVEVVEEIIKGGAQRGFIRHKLLHFKCGALSRRVSEWLHWQQVWRQGV